jgi:endothelin-converting enzyme/putative endopeptidase
MAATLLLAGSLVATPCAGQSPGATPAADAGDGALAALPYAPGLDVLAMDPSVDPCVDFYQYACGGWRTRNPIPPDQASWSVYGKLYEENQRFLRGILESLAQSSAERSVGQQKIGDFYASCMDEARIAQRGAAPLQPFLARIAALRSKRDLPGLLADMHRQGLGGDALFGFDARQDYADANRVIAFADAGGLGMPDRDFYTDGDEHARQMRAQYLEHLGRMFALLGDAPQAAAAEAKTVLAFETALAQASLTRVDRRDPHKLFHKLRTAELQRLTPVFAWTDYLLPLGLGRTAEVNVTQPKFYAALGRLLATTRLEDLQTYLRWHAVHAAAPFLAPQFERENFDFYEHTLRGVPAQPPRWKRCVGQVDTLLGEALGQEFVGNSSRAPSGRNSRRRR